MPGLKEVKYIEDYKLLLVFKNGRKKIHDFRHFLFSETQPMTTKFRNKSLFKKVRVEECGDLTWGDNEMDINPYNLPE